MDKFIITKEMIANARDYLPIGNKELFARTIAKKCVVPSVSAETLSKGEGDIAIPSLYREDFMTKQLCVINLFLKYYLCVTDVGEKPFDTEIYDFYAQSHVFAQLETLRHDAEIKDKVSDILSDFKEFRKYIDNAIYQLLTEKNDLLGRFSKAIQLASDPEYVKSMLEELQNAVSARAQDEQERKVSADE